MIMRSVVQCPLFYGEAIIHDANLIESQAMKMFRQEGS